MTKSYKFTTKDNQQIDIAEDRWGWEAVYKDGFKLKQFGEDGIYHQSSEVDWTKVERLLFYKISNPKKRVVIGMIGGTFICGWRNIVLENGKKKIIVNYIQTGPLFVYALPNDEIVISKRDEDILKFIENG